MADEPKGTGKTITFLVGADVGSSRYEIGDTAPDHVLSPGTRKAWAEQGLIKIGKS